MQKTMSDYLELENFFMNYYLKMVCIPERSQLTVDKAMTPPASTATEQEYNNFLTSVTDEVFFVIQDSINRAKITADSNTICAFINFVNSALDSDYLKFISKCADVKAGHEIYVSLVCFGISLFLLEIDRIEQRRDDTPVYCAVSTEHRRPFEKNIC